MSVGRHWSEPGLEEVAEGVFRMALPLRDIGLKAVNVYAVADGDRLSLIDAGWSDRFSAEALRVALRQLGRTTADVERVLVTHSHGDHYSQAVDLRRAHGTRVALGQGERASMQLMASSGEAVIRSQYVKLQRHGADPVVEALQAAGHRTQIPHHQWESPDVWIGGEELIGMEERELHAIPTPGHTAGHYVFADKEHGLLFAGDHILPHITPSIGFEAVSSERPLADYLESLTLVRAMDDMILLPAHGAPACSAHRRVDELLEHHVERLAACQAAVGASVATAYETAQCLPWTRHERDFADLDPYNKMLATFETAAHLDVLVERGGLEQEPRDGVAYYAPSKTIATGRLNERNPPQH